MNRYIYKSCLCILFRLVMHHLVGVTCRKLNSHFILFFDHAESLVKYWRQQKPTLSLLFFSRELLLNHTIKSKDKTYLTLALLGRSLSSSNPSSDRSCFMAILASCSISRNVSVGLTNMEKKWLWSRVDILMLSGKSTALLFSRRCGDKMEQNCMREGGFFTRIQQTLTTKQTSS